VEHFLALSQQQGTHETFEKLKQAAKGVISMRE
jgi:hypothetical protein